jgi:hypothetical protein
MRRHAFEALRRLAFALAARAAGARALPALPIVRVALLLGTVLLVASCRSPKYLDTVKLEPVCPRVGVLGDADRLTEFNAGRDITDIAFDARLMSVKGSCQFDEDGKKVTLVMDVQFSATRGPSYRGAVNLSYFVATLDDAKNVLGREQFDLPVRFGSDQVRIEGAEKLSESYALPSKDALGAAYQVLVGFVLTPAQLSYNRTHR